MPYLHNTRIVNNKLSKFSYLLCFYCQNGEKKSSFVWTSILILAYMFSLLSKYASLSLKSSYKPLKVLSPICCLHSPSNILKCLFQTSDTNPPMRLMCGHCISRDALTKLASGHKLKCPYCPVEQNPSDAKIIQF